MKEAKELSWSNTSSAMNSGQGNIYLNLRRQMQDLEHSNFSTENEAIKYDLGLNFKKKENYSSYGYYADEEKTLQSKKMETLKEDEMADHFKKNIGNEKLAESGFDEECAKKHQRRKFQLYRSGNEGHSGSFTRKEISDSESNGHSLYSNNSKAINVAESQKNVQTVVSKSKSGALFKNEYITSIGRIEHPSSRGEMVNSGFVNQVNRIQELGKLLNLNTIPRTPSKDNLESVSLNLQKIAEKDKLKNLSFKVFDEVKEPRTITFNHFIDVTTEVEEVSEDDESKRDEGIGSKGVSQVNEQEQRNWSNVRAFGTGVNQRIMDDSFTTNNTINFLATNNSINNVRLQASNLTEITNGPSNVDPVKNPSRFKTESGCFFVY